MTEPDDDAATEHLSPPPAGGPDRVGRYELLGRVGKGGMGVVYRGRDTQLDRPVALKMLLTDVADVPETRERFVREARAAADLTHRNIIEVYDFGEDAGRAYIVMELLVGESLADAITDGTPMPLPRALPIMVGVAEGLAFAHSKAIVHRDLKPGNLFLPTDGPVKILDFGLARIASSKLTRSGLVFGTPDYMSPEQVRGQVADHRSDIFSLGAVFYHLLSGRKPFAAGSLPLVMRKVVDEDPPPLTGIPPAMARIVTRALAKEPAGRYQAMSQLLADLRRVVADSPAPTPAPTADAPTVVLRRLGRYEIVERVGRGGMGVVYRARDPVLDRDVAIKSILGDYTADTETAAQFEREARAAARLQHPNIITIYELGEHDGSPYIVMEFLGGTDLETLMRAGPRLTVARRLDIVAQLCAGLAFAHRQGVVHRDIKPSNVRVLDDGTVKLLDFGIAKVSHSDPTFSDLAGSVAFMAPEQLEGAGVDARSDVFAVGALMYELFAGRAPFVGDSPAATAYQVLNHDPAPLATVASDIPADLSAVVARALAKRPDDRYDDGAAIAKALRPIHERLGRADRDRLGDVDLRHTPVSPGLADVTLADDPAAKGATAVRAEPSRARARSRRWPRLAVGAAVVLLAMAGAGAAGYLAIRGGDLPPVSALDPPPLLPPEPVLALTVESDPPGARILIDGADYAGVDDEPIQLATPATLPFRGRFPETIELRRPDYEPVVVPVPSGNGPTRRLAAELGARPVGTVAAAGPYAFEVWSGSQRLSDAATDHAIRVASGTVTLRLRNTELFLDQRVSVTVVEGERAAVAAPPLGQLTVFSRPGNCEILIDGQRVGFPPVRGRQVASGSHIVARECPDASQNATMSPTVPAGSEGATVTFGPAAP